MPLYEFGYRHWDGERRPRALRFWPITRTGTALAMRSKLLRRIIFFALFPTAYYALLFFAIGAVTDPSSDDRMRAMSGMLSGFGEEFTMLLLAEPVKARQAAWATSFYFFFANIQAWVIMFVVAIVGPPLIAQDIRTKAFLIYFSKPINRWDYIAGKMGVILAFVGAVALLPALLLAILAVAMASDMPALWQMAPLLPRILAASLIIGVPYACIMLLLSSLTNYERFAMFGWLFLWIGGFVLTLALGMTPRGAVVEWVHFLSLRDTTMSALAWVFDMPGVARDFGIEETLTQVIGERPLHGPGLTSAIYLGVVSVISLAIVSRRVSAPSRI